MTRRSSPPLKWHNKLAVVLMLLSLPFAGVISGGHYLKHNKPYGGEVRLWKSKAELPAQVAFDYDWLGWLHAGAMAEGTYKPVYPKGAKL